MAEFTFYRGATSQRIRFNVTNSATGGGLTDLTTGNTAIKAGLTGYYFRDTDATATVISLTAAAPAAAFVAGQLAEIDPANMPGAYELCMPNGSIAAGNGCWVTLKGAVNMQQRDLGIQVVTPANFLKNTALTNFEFVMTDSTNHAPTAGFTVAGTRSIDGGAIVGTTNAPTGVSNGVYKIDFTAADTNGTVISYRFTATGADDLIITVITIPP